MLLQWKLQIVTLIYPTHDGKRDLALEPRNNIWRTVTNPAIDMDNNHCNQEKHCFGSSLKVWHERLGHTNYNDLKRLSDHVESMKISNKDEGICECCETTSQKEGRYQKILLLVQLRYSKLFTRLFWVLLRTSHLRTSSLQSVWWVASPDSSKCTS